MFDPDFNARQEQAHWVELRGYVYALCAGFTFTIILAVVILLASH